MYATVVVSSRQKGIGNGLTYAVPGNALPGRPDLPAEALAKAGGAPLRTVVGCLVNVPLRRRTVEGIVVDVFKTKPKGDFDVRDIAAMVSVQPLLTPERIEAAKWMAEYYVCTVRQALSVFLPGSPWSRLLAKPVNRERGHERHSTIRTNERTWLGEVSLTPRQTAVYKVMKADPRPSLLFGVTGSGKTEIYAALIRDVILEGRSAILLLPEILLTENLVGRFQKLVFRDAIAVVHSRLTAAQRRKAWWKCHSGQGRIVIGSRSALFSPVQNLGLVIIDDEHEWMYKNERAPRYNTRDVAEMLCRGRGTSKAKLVLGTATPSVESWHRAKAGRYQLVELPHRYGGAAPPTVRIVDLTQVRFGKHYPLSPALVNAIRTRLARREQVVLFLNRRGFATSLICLDCRYRFEDPETGLPYTVHYQGSRSSVGAPRCGARAGQLLPQTSRISHHAQGATTWRPYAQARPYFLSHHTGERLEIPMQCPKCGGTKLREVGAGTERVESLLQELFPHARLLRADSDTLKSPGQMRALLREMEEGRADILLGTQSVVKGFDFPNMTLAAVLLADIGLSLPHFRAGERVFQLLTQLTGRSERSQPGEVIIQTFRPQAMEIALSARCDVRAYLERELAERQRAHYPPDTQLVRFVFSGSGAGERSKRFAQALDEKHRSAGRTLPYTSILISRSPSVFSGGKVWQVLVRGKGVREVLKKLPEFDGIVDVDPVECL